LLALRKQLLCAFLSLIFLCGMMPCNICMSSNLLRGWCVVCVGDVSVIKNQLGVYEL
jgi:hypothetical protein